MWSVQPFSQMDISFFARKVHVECTGYFCFLFFYFSNMYSVSIIYTLGGFGPRQTARYIGNLSHVIAVVYACIYSTFWA